jgi:secondary thiamine-phosphate synthase enzyme
MEKIAVRTKKHTQFVRIDDEVQSVIDRSGVREGLCQVFVPHTTAGITINENADPDVVNDIVETLENLVPWSDKYAHDEGNSAAHIKSSMMGFSQTLIIVDGKLAFGTWQSLYFCEFDGPRSREVWVRIIPGR